MMELVENFRACFFNVVFVKGTPEAATTTQGKTRTLNPDLSYPILSRPSHYTTTLTQADEGGGKYFVSTDLNLTRTPGPLCSTIF